MLTVGAVNGGNRGRATHVATGVASSALVHCDPLGRQGEVMSSGAAVAEGLVNLAGMRSARGDAVHQVAKAPRLYAFYGD